MRHSVEDIEYAEYLFDRFYSIGSTENGGVTRLGYTAVEDEMHKTFVELGEEKGYKSYVDEVGNTYLYNGNCKDDGDGEFEPISPPEMLVERRFLRSLFVFAYILHTHNGFNVSFQEKTCQESAKQTTLVLDGFLLRSK